MKKKFILKEDKTLNENVFEYGSNYPRKAYVQIFDGNVTINVAKSMTSVEDGYKIEKEIISIAKSFFSLDDQDSYTMLSTIADRGMNNKFTMSSPGTIIYWTTFRVGNSFMGQPIRRPKTGNWDINSLCLEILQSEDNLKELDRNGITVELLD